MSLRLGLVLGAVFSVGFYLGVWIGPRLSNGERDLLHKDICVAASTIAAILSLWAGLALWSLT